MQHALSRIYLGYQCLTPVDDEKLFASCELNELERQRVEEMQINNHFSNLIVNYAVNDI